ncbi:MAG: KdsC family phosphatase [Phycisphaerales bacterium]
MPDGAPNRRSLHRQVHADPAGIRLLVLDVDGVLTDGRVQLDGRNPEPKMFHVRDGLALRQWTTTGHHVGIITGRTSPAVEARAAELDIEAVFQGVADKGPVIVSLQERFGCSPDQTAVMGDDLPDLPMLRNCGYPMAPADAAAEVRNAAAYVTAARGGFGAVREGIERLMQASGRWAEVIARFDPHAPEVPADPGLKHAVRRDEERA